MAKLIQRFEYSKLFVDEKDFQQHHFNKLVKYNARNSFEYFDIGNNYVKFRNYVGVIQVGDLTIEILPKADNNQENDTTAKKKWHDALILMLRKCGYINVESTSLANLKTRPSSLMDLYIEYFLYEVQSILQSGIRKKYSFINGNLNKLKGRLLFNKNIQYNLTHGERFYTSHQVYDYNNKINQIIKQALTIIKAISFSPFFIESTKNLLFYFDTVDYKSFNENELDKIVFTKENLHYKNAYNIAKLIITNYSPDLKSGNDNLLAFLFDMNLLFERYIYKQIKNVEKQYNFIEVHYQNSKPFWEYKKIRPDIVVKKGNENYVIDTKWKIMKNHIPSDDDLKQMFVYNLFFTCDSSVLLYPKVNLESTDTCNYEEFPNYKKEHGCKIYFCELFEYGKLKANIGYEILKDLKIIES